jgi:hypothetical protein
VVNGCPPMATSMMIPPARRGAATGEATCFQWQGEVLPSSRYPASIGKAWCSQWQGTLLPSVRCSASTGEAWCSMWQGAVLPVARRGSSTSGFHRRPIVLLCCHFSTTCCEVSVEVFCEPPARFAAPARSSAKHGAPAKSPASSMWDAQHSP